MCHEARPEAELGAAHLFLSSVLHSPTHPLFLGNWPASGQNTSPDLRLEEGNDMWAIAIRITDGGNTYYQVCFEPFWT
jgi:hypothetical protein